jgi:hypothetical protein
MPASAIASGRTVDSPMAAAYACALVVASATARERTSAVSASRWAVVSAQSMRDSVAPA